MSKNVYIALCVFCLLSCDKKRLEVAPKTPKTPKGSLIKKIEDIPNVGAVIYFSTPNEIDIFCSPEGAICINGNTFNFRVASEKDKFTNYSLLHRETENLIKFVGDKSGDGLSDFYCIKTPEGEKRYKIIWTEVDGKLSAVSQEEPLIRE